MSRDSYRSELIQVAAVALAAASDHDRGEDSLSGLGSLLDEVVVERGYQVNKWGTRHHDPVLWMTILTAELGEVCQAILKP